VSVAQAQAKINLALVVGPLRPDGKHEVVSVLAPLELADRIELQAADELTVAGFDQDTLVRAALESLAAASSSDPRWRVTIEKRIPVAAGLGGGSSDAAAALGLVNATLAKPLAPERLHELATALGADVPFFLEPGPKLARADGTQLEALEFESNFVVLLLLPRSSTKSSTADVYAAFDARSGARGFGRSSRTRFAPATSPGSRRTISRLHRTARCSRSSAPSARMSQVRVPRSTASSVTAREPKKPRVQSRTSDGSGSANPVGNLAAWRRTRASCNREAPTSSITAQAVPGSGSSSDASRSRSGSRSSRAFWSRCT
jgi:4-diphosphocytidyl-2C-methyl-D-erythritol kinase